LQSLKPSDSESYRDELWSRRQDGTCNWLLDDKRYKTWAEVNGQAILWIHGDPGCGKSVMSSFLTKEIIHDKGSQLSMAFFFCDDKDERLRTAEAILLNLLAQFLRYIPDVIVHFLVESEYATLKAKTCWTFGMLWRVFERIITSTNTGDMYILIDALGNRTLLDIRYTVSVAHYLR
jgi:hypothetical protein